MKRKEIKKEIVKKVRIQGAWKILSDPSQDFIVFSAVSNRDERESCSLRRYCTSVQSNSYIATQLWFVYYIVRQSSEIVINLRIGPYFPNTLFMSHFNVAFGFLLFFLFFFFISGFSPQQMQRPYCYVGQNHLGLCTLFVHTKLNHKAAGYTEIQNYLYSFLVRINFVIYIKISIVFNEFT